MLNLVPYLIKLSISLSVVYLFYQLCLRRLTFYTWNRWYLILYSMICFIIPFVSLSSLFSRPAIEQSPIVQYIPAIEQITYKHTHAWPSQPAFTMNILYVVIATAGMLFMLGRCLIQFYSLLRVRMHAKLLYDNKVKLYHVDKPIIPFSFGNAIYINQHQHSQQELSDIIRHEFIHVKQRHSADMIWSEVLCIINWYNPFAWLLRKAIRQNLEFIADHQVLQTGLDRKQYQYLLLKVMGTTEFSIANKFNFSSLKKRIAMMNKTKSARVNLLRFAFILPLLVVILLAFRTAIPPRPLYDPLKKWSDPVKVVYDTVPERNAAMLPNEIKSIHVDKKNMRITLVSKDGRVEAYNLTDKKDREAFKNKYGEDLPEVPVTPVPPIAIGDPVTIAAPAPAAAPVAVAGEAPGAPPVPIATPTPATAPVQSAIPVTPIPPARDYIATGDDCFNKKGYCITVADNNGECVVIVKNKELKIVEAVALTDWNENKRYAEKYGDIPPARVKPPKTVLGKPAPDLFKPVPDLAKPVPDHAKPVADTVQVSKPAVRARVEKEVKDRIAEALAHGAQKITVTINEETTMGQLEEIKKLFAAYGVAMIIDHYQLNGNYLKGISGSLSRNDGKNRCTFESDNLGKSGVILTITTGAKADELMVVNVK